MRIKLMLDKIEDNLTSDGCISLVFIGDSNTFYSHYVALKLTQEEAAGMQIGQEFELVTVAKEVEDVVHG